VDGKMAKDDGIDGEDEISSFYKVGVKNHYPITDQ
jgi:hypothetical protein